MERDAIPFPMPMHLLLLLSHSLQQKCPPTKPTSPNQQKIKKQCLQKCPSATSQKKISSSSLSQLSKEKESKKKILFFTQNYVGSLVFSLFSFFVLVRVCEVNRNPKNLPLSSFSFFLCLLPPLAIFSLSYFYHQAFIFIIKLATFLLSFSLISLYLGYRFWFCGLFLFLYHWDLTIMLKKKMKGIAAASVEIAPAQASAFSGYDDPRLRFRHQSLLQDYQELLKEVQAKKNKLQMMKQKKLNLQSEVRFLRRRHQYLTVNQPSTSTVDRNSVKAQQSQVLSKKMVKERNYSRKAASLPRQALGFDLNKKGKACKEKEATLRNPLPVFDLNQKLKTYHEMESTLQNSIPVLDLNQKERVYSRKEAAAQNKTLVFDLNQISREEEELQFDNELWRVEESKNTSVRGGSDEQLNDTKLAACRNIRNRANRAGKRKISWQDQVALRV